MARTVTGVLKLPGDNQPLANARVFFVAQETTATVLEGVSAGFSTGGDGSYSWSVEDGAYGVSVKYSGRRWPLGSVVIAPGDPIDLDDLLILE